MGGCKDFTEATVGWILNNKIIVLLSLLSFCLFVSTLALAGQKRGLGYELEECRSSLSTTVTTPAAVTTESTSTTPASAPQAGGEPSPSAGQSSSLENQNKLLQLLTGAS